MMLPRNISEVQHQRSARARALRSTSAFHHPPRQLRNFLQVLRLPIYDTIKREEAVYKCTNALFDHWKAGNAVVIHCKNTFHRGPAALAAIMSLAFGVDPYTLLDNLAQVRMIDEGFYTHDAALRRPMKPQELQLYTAIRWALALRSRHLGEFVRLPAFRGNLAPRPVDEPEYDSDAVSEISVITAASQGNVRTFLHQEGALPRPQMGGLMKGRAVRRKWVPVDDSNKRVRFRGEGQSPPRTPPFRHAPARRLAACPLPAGGHARLRRRARLGGGRWRGGRGQPGGGGRGPGSPPGLGRPRTAERALASGCESNHACAKSKCCILIPGVTFSGLSDVRDGGE